ncbi:hypothetical protein RF11_13657 [Thelohanellus kitauei]|uniref:LysM domain-containing protein n=1 Tax=Thelohanellus kitauei TaxID=669202 RepID=A0A0C2IND5_THEKT|nr:hypothetical protein RF11_13657 [Thelohanellus kitauei]
MELPRDQSVHETEPEGRTTVVAKYTVQNDDTLTKIALKFNSSIGELRIINQLSSEYLIPSQTLYVPMQPGVTYEGLSEETEILKSSSPIFPGFHQSLISNKPNVPNKEYSISVKTKSVELEASLFTCPIRKEKKTVRIIFHPKKVQLLFRSKNNSPSITSKDLFELNSENCPYSLPFEQIKRFSFYDSLDWITNSSPDEW